MKSNLFYLALFMFFPIVMIIDGLTPPPKKIGSPFGYRMPMAKKNQYTWDFANRYSKKLDLKMGFIFLPICVILYVILIFLGDEVLGIVWVALMIILFIIATLHTILVTIALRKNFDRHGTMKKSFNTFKSENE